MKVGYGHYGGNNSPPKKYHGDVRGLSIDLSDWQEKIDMAEEPRDALVSIEKSFAIDEWPWNTPKVITVAASKWYGISLPVRGLLFQRLYLGPFSRHYHFWIERDCL